jgi:hypothetical protein
MTEKGGFGPTTWRVGIKRPGGPVKAKSRFSAQNHTKKSKGRSFSTCDPQILYFRTERLMRHDAFPVLGFALFQAAVFFDRFLPGDRERLAYQRLCQCFLDV